MRGATAFVLVVCAGILGGGCRGFPECRPSAAAPGIYTGCKPRTQEDFDGLRQQGIRTILSLETWYMHIEPERRLARENGIGYTNVGIWASPLEPSEKQVKKALLVLRDRSLQPIFVHCFLGEDRNNFIIALYRVYYEDWTAEAAWRELLRSGFHTRMSLRGFTTYYWSHARKPEWAQQTAAEATGK